MKSVVWITGASSGIGQAVALAMAKYDYQLVISGRNQEALDALAHQTGALSIPFDVTLRQAHLDAAALILERFGRVDIAFLNAGHCEYVDAAHFASLPFAHMIQTNFMSMVYGIEAVLPLLRLAKAGHLVGMSSAVAYLGLPRSEAYGASKAAIRNCLQGLRVSLAPEHITVSIVYPGFVKTPLTDQNDFAMPGLISATAAAQKIVAGIRRRQRDIKVPRWFVWLTQIISVMPNWLKMRLLGRMTKRL